MSSSVSSVSTGVISSDWACQSCGVPLTGFSSSCCHALALYALHESRMAARTRAAMFNRSSGVQRSRARTDGATESSVRRSRAIARMRETLTLPPPPEVVDRPGSRSRGRDVQEQEAVQHRQLALVHFRPEDERACAERVALEVRDGHQAAGEECHRPREQADGDEDAAEEFDRAGEPVDVPGDL